MRSLHDLYTQHAALSLEKQLALGEVIGDRNFSFDADAGVMRFGQDLAFPMQVLGSVSRQSGTWLWAWASAQPQPPALLQAAHQLKALGQRDDIDELMDEEFDIVPPPAPVQSLLHLHQQLTGLGDYEGPLDGHYMAMLAAGICQADAYYGADYGRGIAYVLLPRVPEAVAHHSDEPARMAAVFSQLLQLPYPVNHRAAFAAYIQQKGYTAEQNGFQVRGTKTGHNLTATFDGTDRLSALEANGQPVA